jgi:hypothetical protein
MRILGAPQNTGHTKKQANPQARGLLTIAAHTKGHPYVRNNGYPQYTGRPKGQTDPRAGAYLRYLAHRKAPHDAEGTEIRSVYNHGARHRPAFDDAGGTEIRSVYMARQQKQRDDNQESKSGRPKWAIPTRQLAEDRKPPRKSRSTAKRRPSSGRSALLDPSNLSCEAAYRANHHEA